MEGFVGGFGSCLIARFSAVQLTIHGLDFGIPAEMTGCLDCCIQARIAFLVPTLQRGSPS